MFIKFHSDGSETRPGFLISYEATVSDITAGTTSSTLAESPMTSEAVTVSTTTVTYSKQYILSRLYTCAWLKKYQVFTYLFSATDTTESDITAGTTSFKLTESPMTSEAVTVPTTTVTFGKQNILSRWLKYLPLSK